MKNSGIRKGKDSLVFGNHLGDREELEETGEPEDQGEPGEPEEPGDPGD